MNRKCFGKICEYKSKQFFSSIRSIETRLVIVIVLDVIVAVLVVVVDVLRPADLFVVDFVAEVVENRFLIVVFLYW